MKHMHPFVPIADGESLVSWVDRFARIQCGVSTTLFLQMFRIFQNDVRRLKSPAIERLAQISGIPQKRLTSAMYLPLGNRRYRYSGQEFPLSFLSRRHIKFCPKCLLEDMNDTIEGPSLPIGRLLWVFSPIRTCSIHQVQLTARPSAGISATFANLSEHLPPFSQLKELANSAQHIQVSGLQIYVENRFLGKEAHFWLDNQDIDLASKTTEMLGACVEFGAHFTPGDLTEAQWDRAGHVGFEYTSRGEQGVHDGLTTIQRSPESVSHSDPKGMFGRLYNWLESSRFEKPAGPIREVLREHILDTMVVKPGKMLLGRKVESSRRQTVETLSAQFDIDPNTVTFALQKAGMLSTKTQPQNTLETVPAYEAGELMRKLSRAVPNARVPGYIGCSSKHVRDLISEEGLFSAIKDNGHDSWRHKGVDSRELDRMLEKIYAHGTTVERASLRMASIAETSTALRVPFVAIVRILLKGRLKKVETLNDSNSLFSVFVNPQEVMRELMVEADLPGLAVSEVARELNLKISAVYNILSTKDNDGQPYLKKCGRREFFGNLNTLIEPASLEEFKLKFKKLSDVYDCSPEEFYRLREKLRSRGIQPVWQSHIMRADYYRSEDL